MRNGGASLIGGDHRDDARRHLSGLLVSVDLDVLAGNLGELTNLDVLAKQSCRFFNGFLDGAFIGLGGQQVVGGIGFGVHGIAQHGVGELDELRGLGHEVGLGVQLNSVTGLAIRGLDDLGSDGTFLSCAAFTLAGCALRTNDFLGASDVAFSLGESLLDVHHASAGVFTHLLDQSGGNCCHSIRSPYIWNLFDRLNNGC